jgi:glycosyltransferase involved in cell wall biosynthesis
MLDEVQSRAEQFDILHFHLGEFLHFPIFNDMRERTVTTAHGRLDLADLPEHFRRWPGFPMVSISLQQRSPLVANIHHGLPLLKRSAVRASRRTNQPPYLAFLGRLAPEKRPDRAVEIARRSGMVLKIVAKVGDDDQSYFKSEIQPLIDGQQVRFIGELGEAEKPSFSLTRGHCSFP